MKSPPFSDNELEFLSNPAIFPLKRQITNKVRNIFADIERLILEELSNNPFPFPDQILKRTGKISKGENYNGQPYVVLDFPRLIKHDQIFLFRHVCLWGHYFILSFILTGTILDQYRPHLCKKIAELSNSELLIGMADNPWELLIDQNKLMPVASIHTGVLQSHIQKSSHINLALTLSFLKYENLSAQSLNFFRNILDLLR